MECTQSAVLAVWQYCDPSYPADLSVQQHIKNGIPQHQDYVINNYFDDTCKTIRLSLLWQYA